MEPVDMAREQVPTGPLSHVYDRPDVEVVIDPLDLPGILVHPAAGHGIVLFAQASGGGPLDPHNRLMAERLQRKGLGTLLFDLLQPEEATDRRNIFDISLLAERLALATDWARAQELREVPVGYLGTNTGSAAALVADTLAQHRIAAIVSQGGRPDLAGTALPEVRAPTLLIVGGKSSDELELSKEAFTKLTCEKELNVVAGDGPQFEEPGALDQVVTLSRDWFTSRLRL
jgi:dienelactone hydrolase